MRRVVLIAIWFVVLATPAFAQFVVIDPANLAQTILIAERTLNEYNTLLRQYQTIVKLARVCLLAPMVFVIGVIYARRKLKETGVSPATREKKINYLRLFPMFVLGFLAMALLKTFGLIPDLTFHGGKGALNAGEHTFSLAGLADQLSRFCIIISMAGVGLETKFASMKQTGLKPFSASLFTVAVVALLILGLIRALGI